MHSFRLRYVVLGLLIYLQNAFCRTCGSDLDDIASKVVISDIVFEGRLSDLVDKSNGEFVYEYKPGEVYRGEENLPKSRRDPEKYRTVPVGIFQGNCTAEVDRTKKYIVFLKNNVNEEFYEWTVLPLQASRKVKKEIQKTVDCLPKCAKEPKVRITPKGGRISYNEGKTLQIKCRVSGPSGSPLSTIEWFKDGQLLEKSKKYKYRNSKGKSSRLRIRKVSERDSGTYRCKASNVNGFTEENIIVTVNTSKKEEAESSTTTSSTSTTTTTSTAIPNTTISVPDQTLPHFVECEEQTLCLNGGTCYKSKDDHLVLCRCASNFTGSRCEIKNPVTRPDVRPTNDRRQFDRQMTILGLVVGVLVLLAVCIAGYCMAREKRKAYRKKIAERRRLQNLYTNGTHRPKPGPEEKELLQPVTAHNPGIELRHMFPSAYDASTQTDMTWSDHLPSTPPSLSHHPLPPPPDNPVCPQNHFPSESHLSAPELQSLILPTTSTNQGFHPGNTSHQPLVNAAMVNVVVESEPDQNSAHSSPNQSQNSRTESAHDGMPSLKDDKDPSEFGHGVCHEAKAAKTDDLVDVVNLLEQSKSSLEAALIEFDAQSDYDNQQSSDLEVNIESEPDPQALEEMQGKDAQEEEIGNHLFVDSEGEESDSDSSAAEEQALFHKLKSRNSSVTSDQNESFPFGERNGLGDNSWQNAFSDKTTSSSPLNYAFNPYASDGEQTGSNYFGNFGTPSCSRRGSQQQNDLMLTNPLLFDPDPDATTV